MVTALILHHSSDLDGYGSAVVAIKWLEEQNFYIKTKTIPVNYNVYNFNYIQRTVNQINQTDPVWVFILDFSLKTKEMKWLIDNSQKVFWCDHHPTIQNTVKDVETYLDEKQVSIQNTAVISDRTKNYFFNFDFTGEKAAILLTWEMLNPNIEANTYIKYINNLDLWKFDDYKIIYFREFIYKLLWKNYKFLKCFIFNNQLLNTNIKDDKLQEIINTVGKIFIEKKNDQIQRTTQKFVSGKLKGYKACLFNNTISEINSDVLNYMCREQKYDIALSYFDDLVNNTKGFSIRCVRDDIDVAEIVKQFGGGGHSKAAGFSINLQDGNELIQKIKRGIKI